MSWDTAGDLLSVHINHSIVTPKCEVNVIPLRVGYFRLLILKREYPKTEHPLE
jgi:hypothetical protein